MPVVARAISREPVRPVVRADDPARETIVLAQLLVGALYVVLVLPRRVR